MAEIESSTEGVVPREIAEAISHMRLEDVLAITDSHHQVYMAINSLPVWTDAQIAQACQVAPLIPIQLPQVRMPHFPRALGQILHLPVVVSTDHMDSLRIRTELIAAFANYIETVDSQALEALRRVGTADQVVHGIVAGLPIANPTDEAIGPFYTSTSLAARLGVTRQAIHKQRAAGKILGVVTTDEEILFPSFQFGRNGKPLPHLAEARAALNSGFPDEWAQAWWLNQKRTALGGETAAEMLRRDTKHAISTVLNLAETESRRIAS